MRLFAPVSDPEIAQAALAALGGGVHRRLIASEDASRFARAWRRRSLRDAFHQLRRFGRWRALGLADAAELNKRYAAARLAEAEFAGVGVTVEAAGRRAAAHGESLLLAGSADEAAPEILRRLEPSFAAAGRPVPPLVPFFYRAEREREILVAALGRDDQVIGAHGLQSAAQAEAVAFAAAALGKASPEAYIRRSDRSRFAPAWNLPAVRECVASLTGARRPPAPSDSFQPANERYVSARMAARSPTLVGLNPEQARAVATGEDTNLVVAGAGTGKTHTLIAKIRDLIEYEGVAPERIAYFTFGNKAAAECHQRLASTLGTDVSERVAVGTLHELARQVVARKRGSRPRYSDLADDGPLWREFVQGALEEAVGRDPALTPLLGMRIAEYELADSCAGDASDRQRKPRYRARLRGGAGETPEDALVKSQAERSVAFALWLHRLDPWYEPAFPLPAEERDPRRSDYLPDFWIPLPSEEGPEKRKPPRLESGAEPRAADEEEDEPGRHEAAATTAEGAGIAADVQASGPDAAKPWREGLWLEVWADGFQGDLPPAWLEGDAEAHNSYRAEQAWKRGIHARWGTRFVQVSAGEIHRALRHGGYDEISELVLGRVAAALGVPAETLLGCRRPEQEVAEWAGLGRRGAINPVAHEIGRYIRISRQNIAAETPASTRKVLREGAEAVGAEEFERLARAVRSRYEERLADEGKTDYEGLILDALEIARERSFRSPWEALLVDEWQDVNGAQAALVRACARAPAAGGLPRLWCVGDDWQAIYGFQGGDVGLVSGFAASSAADGLGASRTDLEQTYRFGEPLATTSSNFVLRDKANLRKRVRGWNQAWTSAKHPAVVSLASQELTTAGEARFTNGDPTPATSALGAVLACLAEDSDARRQGPFSVLVLARRRALVEDSSLPLETLAEQTKAEWIANPHRLPQSVTAKRESLDEAARRVVRRLASNRLDHGRLRRFAEQLGLDLRLDVQTIHKAKGLEADYVVFLDGEDRRTDEREAVLERALQPIRPASYSMEGEERRLRYVALTRARRKCYLLAPLRDESAAFCDEIWKDAAGRYDVSQDELSPYLQPYLRTIPCPVCDPKRTGRGPSLVARKNSVSGKAFLACESYSRSALANCGHTERGCEACGAGLMEHVEPGTKARCSKADCGLEVGFCACSPAKPLRLRRNAKSRRPFLGCQDWRVDGMRGCSKTMALNGPSAGRFASGGTKRSAAMAKP